MAVDRDIEPGTTSNEPLGEWECQPVAVLTSGGLDSAILAAELAQRVPRVVPIYLRFGLVWEPTEFRVLRRFLDAVRTPALEPCQTFDMPLAPVYGEHWSTTGDRVPDAQTPDEAVFLPGRNVLLCVQAAVWCHRVGIPTLALAPLGSNPFPDATPDFFASLQRTLNLALEAELRIVRPYDGFSKRTVLLRGASFPLEHTLSCIRPVGDDHCGRCNKCAERQQGFAAAGLADPTTYAYQTSGSVKK